MEEYLDLVPNASKFHLFTIVEYIFFRLLIAVLIWYVKYPTFISISKRFKFTEYIYGIALMILISSKYFINTFLLYFISDVLIYSEDLPFSEFNVFYQIFIFFGIVIVSYIGLSLPGHGIFSMSLLLKTSLNIITPAMLITYLLYSINRRYEKIRARKTIEELDNSKTLESSKSSEKINNITLDISKLKRLVNYMNGTADSNTIFSCIMSHMDKQTKIDIEAVIDCVGITEYFRTTSIMSFIDVFLFILCLYTFLPFLMSAIHPFMLLVLFFNGKIKNSYSLLFVESLILSIFSPNLENYDFLYN